MLQTDPDQVSRFFKMREKDASFGEKGVLKNGRVLSIISDAQKAITICHDHIDNGVERKKCLDKIMVIIPHHCGDHSLCKDRDLCQYSKVKVENPNWPEE